MKTAENKKHPGSHLQMALALEGRALQAANGRIGTLESLCFDAVSWVMRYLVVDTAGWLRDRRVLVPPLAVDDASMGEPDIYVELTRAQIEGSPPFDAERPILRAYEARYHAYYKWPAYWEIDSRAAQLLSQVPVSPEIVGEESLSSRYQESHLHLSSELRGSKVVTRDGAAGNIRDLVIDIRYWLLRYLLITIRDDGSVRNVLLSPEWIRHVDWNDRSVNVALHRAAILNAPCFDPARGISREHEVRLLEHYGHPATD